jgi:hypothetical protein
VSDAGVYVRRGDHVSLNVQHPGGGSVAWRFADPDGNLIELTSYDR